MPFRTCDDGTSPGCTLADKKIVGLSNCNGLASGCL